MKRLIAFAAFALLHVLGWVGTHAWLTANPKTALVVADTSFSMKDEFPAMRRWIDEHVDGLRYTRVLVGTDKALIGPLDELRSTEAIFRTSFGRSDAESLKRYGVGRGRHPHPPLRRQLRRPGLGHGHVRRRAVAGPPLGRVTTRVVKVRRGVPIDTAWHCARYSPATVPPRR